MTRTTSYKYDIVYLTIKVWHPMVGRMIQRETWQRLVLFSVRHWSKKKNYFLTRVETYKTKTKRSMSQLASPTLAPLKVISSLLSRFESVVCAMVLSNPESESTVRSEDTKKKVRNISNRKWNNGNRRHQNFREQGLGPSWLLVTWMSEMSLGMTR